VVEWGARLPAGLVVGLRTTKPILRAVAAKYLPPEAVGAPKQGFEIPLTRWMRDDLHDQVVERSMDSALVADLFRRDRVEAFLGRRTGLDDERWAKRAWLIFMLAQWDAVR
jgi:asparagine synthase (glutamine-hydrolysing)